MFLTVNTQKSESAHTCFPPRGVSGTPAQRGRKTRSVARRPCARICSPPRSIRLWAPRKLCAAPLRSPPTLLPELRSRGKTSSLSTPSPVGKEGAFNRGGEGRGRAGAGGRGQRGRQRAGEGGGAESAVLRAVTCVNTKDRIMAWRLECRSYTVNHSIVLQSECGSHLAIRYVTIRAERKRKWKSIATKCLDDIFILSHTWYASQPRCGPHLAIVDDVKLGQYDINPVSLLLYCSGQCRHHVSHAAHLHWAGHNQCVKDSSGT